MRFEDVLKFSINNMIHRGLRSWLTIIGIVIGIAAVVALVSIGQGFQSSVKSSLETFGGDFIFITPGFSQASGGFGGGGFGGGGEGGFGAAGIIAGNLTENDLRVIKSIPGASLAIGMINEESDLEYINEIASINVQGADPEIWRDFTTVPLEGGRYMQAGDSKVAILGYNVAKNLFKEEMKLNRIVTVNGQGFRVIGILKQGGPGTQTDNLVVLPIEDARKIFEELDENQFSAILVKISDNNDVGEIADQVESKLLVSHHITKDKQDFTLTTSQSILETVGQISAAINLFLGGIAGISLLVGAVGVANTMFTSVLERTKLIGILKSLGATNGEVMKLFLVESALIGLVGGSVGVLIGYGASYAIGLFGGNFGPGGQLTTQVTPELALSMLAFSVLIGALSGLLPARRAANLQPIEALRYE